jgi:hypothetical protein
MVDPNMRKAQNRVQPGQIIYIYTNRGHDAADGKNPGKTLIVTFKKAKLFQSNTINHWIF